MSRRRHKHLNEYTCCEQCSNSVAADGTYTCNRKTIIENYMLTEEYFWCGGEMFVRKEKWTRGDKQMNDIKKILKEYPDLVKELDDLKKQEKQIQKELNNMTQKGGYTERDSVSGGNGGKQHYAIEGFPYRVYTEKKTRLQAKQLRIASKKAQLNAVLEEINELIEKEPNVRIRRMLRYRYNEKLTWYQVAMRMGKKCTAESCRKEVERYLKEK